MCPAAGLLQADDVAPKPSRSYRLKTSSARPTPCVPFITIVRTLCVATVIYRLHACAQFLVSLCRRRRRSALHRCLRLRAKAFLLSVTLFLIPLSLSRSCFVFWSRDVGSAVSPRVAPPIFRLRSEFGFLHLPSAMLASTFLAKRIQPFLSLIDREVEFRPPLVGYFYFIFILFYLFIFVRKNPRPCDCTEIRTHVPTSEGLEVTN